MWVGTGEWLGPSVRNLQKKNLRERGPGCRALPAACGDAEPGQSAAQTMTLHKPYTAKEASEENRPGDP